jgi:hypothetical protein
MEFLVRWAIRSYRTKAASEVKRRTNDYQLGGRIEAAELWWTVA